MRAYRIEVKGRVRYAGTQGDARDTKAALLDALGLPPRSKEFTLEEADIPSDKAGLLTFINGLSERADPRE